MSALQKLETLFEDLMSRMTERLLGRPTDPTTIEIRQSVLEEVESAVEPIGRGERIFPFDRLVLRVASPDARRRALLESAFRDRRFFEEVRARVRRAGAAVPPGMTIEVAGVKVAGEAWIDPRYQLEMSVSSRKGGRSEGREAVLRVTRGRAAQRRYAIGGSRVNIGRRADVLDEEEHLVRRNDVAFDDDTQDEINRTVSRVHAHLSRDAETGGWRIVDDGSAYGTRVFRDGGSIEVPRGPRGIRLQAGDDVYCGQASLRFDAGDVDH